MKNLLICCVFGIILGIYSCGHPSTPKNAKVESLTDDGLNSGNSIVLADTITYDILLKNPNPNDEYMESCLRRLDRKNLVKVIFNAIYSGKLKAFTYIDNKEVSLDTVKKFEREFKRDRIGKIQFEEEWYLDEKNLKFGKKIKSIMFGYENYENDGSVRGYKAGFKVYMN